MNILFFSDLHGDMKALAGLKAKSRQADMVACLGDLSTMERNISSIVKKIDSFNKPILMIHGNHEDEDALRSVCSSCRNIIFLHKAIHIVEDYIFMGYGGDGFSSTDSEFDKVAREFFIREAQGKRRMVLLTHGPPYNTKIDILGSDPRGSKSYRKFIDSLKPHLAISGHLHENAGKHHKIGRTFFLNPGKEGAIVNL